MPAITLDNDTIEALGERIAQEIEEEKIDDLDTDTKHLEDSDSYNVVLHDYLTLDQNTLDAIQNYVSVNYSLSVNLFSAYSLNSANRYSIKTYYDKYNQQYIDTKATILDWCDQLDYFCEQRNNDLIITNQSLFYADSDRYVILRQSDVYKNVFLLWLNNNQARQSVQIKRLNDVWYFFLSNGLAYEFLIDNFSSLISTWFTS